MSIFVESLQAVWCQEGAPDPHAAGSLTCWGDDPRVPAWSGSSALSGPDSPVPVAGPAAEPQHLIMPRAAAAAAEQVCRQRPGGCPASAAAGISAGGSPRSPASAPPPSSAAAAQQSHRCIRHTTARMPARH